MVLLCRGISTAKSKSSSVSQLFTYSNKCETICLTSVPSRLDVLGDQKKTSRARSHIFSYKQMLWRQTRYQHVAERLRHLLSRCLVSLRYAYCPKKQFQQHGNSFISQTILSLSSPSFGNCEKSWIPNLLWRMEFEWGTEVNHFANEEFPKRLLIYRYVELHKMLTGKWWQLFHSRWGIQNSKFSFDLVFRMVIIA